MPGNTRVRWEYRQRLIVLKYLAKLINRFTCDRTRENAPAHFPIASTLLSGITKWVAEVAANKLAVDFAQDLSPYGVSAVALNPGIVRTEAVLRAAEFLDLSNSESPQLIGRVIAALWKDRKLFEKSGHVLVAAALAQEYGITDVDGKNPIPLARENFP